MGKKQDRCTILVERIPSSAAQQLDGWMDGWIYVKMEMYSIFFSSAAGSIKRAAGLFASQEGGVKSILLLLLGWRAICRIYIGRFM
jgi:hypothetical protein